MMRNFPYKTVRTMRRLCLVEISEPRTQRSGVSGDPSLTRRVGRHTNPTRQRGKLCDRPLTPLRCVRGSDNGVDPLESFTDPGARATFAPCPKLGSHRLPD